MKKVLSLLCVVAMMFSFATASADEYSAEITATIANQTETEVVIDYTLNTAIDIASISIYTDLTDALAKGATVKDAAAVNASKAMHVAAQKMFQVTYTDTTGATLTGDVKLATLTLDITNVTEAFTLTRKADAGRIKTEIGTKAGVITSDCNIALDLEITLAAPVEATAETVAAWDTEDGLLVIAKLLKADAAEYGVSIKDYKLPETSSKAGFGPDFPMIDANKPSAAGYYGINIIGIAAGDYEVAAYADDVYADYTTVTVQ